MPSRVLTKQFQKNQARTRRVVALATVLILLLGAVSTWQLSRLGNDADEVTKSYDALRAAGDLMEALLATETGQRGYALTGQNSYLEDYRKARAAVPEKLAEFHNHLREYLDTAERTRIQKAAEAKLAEMEQILELYDSGRRELALVLIAQNKGKLFMDDLRGILEIIRASELHRLENSHAGLQNTRVWGTLTIIGATAFTLLLAFALFQFQSSAHGRLIAAVGIIQRQEGFLTAMLSSINSPVFLIDLNEQVLFANSAARALLHVEDTDIVGRPFQDFVRIGDAAIDPSRGSLFQRAISEEKILREPRISVETKDRYELMGITVYPVSAREGKALGTMVTLHGLREEEDFAIFLHARDIVQKLEAALGRIITSPGSHETILEDGAEEVQRVLDAHLVRVWLSPPSRFDPVFASATNIRPAFHSATDSVRLDSEPPQLDASSALLEVRCTYVRSPSSGHPHNEPALETQIGIPSYVLEAWSQGRPVEEPSGQISRWALPLAVGDHPIGILEVALRAPVHDHLREELPRCAMQLALGYERRKNVERLARLAAEKDQFIATLSHELRGPLVPLRFAVDSLRGEAPKGETTSIVSMLHRQVTQLQRLVDDLLDAQRLRRGTFSLQTEQVELASILEQSFESALPLMAKKSQTLEVHGSARDLHLQGDLARLVQVFFNLLNNASRYSPSGTQITVTIEEIGDMVSVSIQDEGIGISPESLSQVFEMFKQGASGSSEGLGIGLALVHNLVHLHRGQVRASSKGQGLGSTFTVLLPLVSQPTAQTAVPPLRAESLSNTPSTGSSEAEAVSATTDPVQSAPTPARCLVVDDDVDSAETFALLLEAGGYQTSVAHDPDDALRSVGRLTPELIFLDLTLPGHDRWSLIKSLRRTLGDVPRIIAITGHADESVRSDALAHGFDQFLVKPVSRDELLRTAALQMKRGASPPRETPRS